MAKKQATQTTRPLVGMGAPLEPTQMQPPTQIVRRPDMPTYYASSTGVITTNYDISLIFGKMEQNADNKLFVDQFAKVTMSYHHAKVLAEMLGKTIEKYEKDNGLLNVKPIITTG